MIRFDKYILRPLDTNDLGRYFTLIENNRSRLEDFFAGTVSRTRTREDASLFLAEIIQKAKNKSYFPYVVEDPESRKLVAFIDVKNIDWSISKAELGFYTDEKYAGKGLTSKAFPLLVDHLFEQFEFKKLFLRTHQSNIAAQKLAEKSGFEIEGTIRCDYKTTKGELVDLIYYGRLAKEI